MGMLATPAVEFKGRSGPSGGEKLRRRNALPKAVWIFQRQSHRVLGAAVATGAWRDEESKQLFLDMSRAVPFADAPILEAAMWKFEAGVFHLRLDAEIRFRKHLALVGGMIAVHFAHYLTFTTWKVVAINECETLIAWSDPSLTCILPVPISHIVAMGVVGRS